MPAYEIQLSDIKDDVQIQQIAGSCSSTDLFLSMVNEAQEGLINRGGWFDLQQRMNFCITGCHIVWPHFVGTILGVRFCDGVASMQNQWYSFVNNNYGAAYSEVYGLGSGYGTGQFNPYWGGQNRCVIEDDGTRPCYNEIDGDTGKLIRYVVVKKEDYGKTITLFGRQFGAQPLQEKDSTGAWVMGQTLVAAQPFVSTSNLVTVIDSVTREATQGMAYLYQYDPNTNVLRDLAAFQPYETNPRYRASRIANIGQRGRKDSNGICQHSIEALVKLKFIPLKHDRDFLAISNRRALKLAIQAVKLGNANEDNLAQEKWALAVEELSLELENLQPKKQIPVRIGLGAVISSPI